MAKHFMTTYQCTITGRPILNAKEDVYNTEQSTANDRAPYSRVLKDGISQRPFTTDSSGLYPRGSLVASERVLPL